MNLIFDDEFGTEFDADGALIGLVHGERPSWGQFSTFNLYVTDPKSRLQHLFSVLPTCLLCFPNLLWTSVLPAIFAHRIPSSQQSDLSDK
jgi:hypothetical protein